MAKRKKGEYTRSEPSAPPPPVLLPPAKAARASQFFVAYVFGVGVIFLWDLRDPGDQPILYAATDWLIRLDWPETMEDLWEAPPLIEASVRPVAE